MAKKSTYEEPVQKPQVGLTPRRMYLLICIVGVMVTGILGYGFFKGDRMNRVYAPLIDAVMEIQLEATTAHLWFEEIISGDHEDIESVWKHQDRAAWYAQAMLEGGKNPEGTFIPLDDAEMRRKIKNIQEKVKKFREITRKRLEAIETSGVGSPIDQRYDQVFRSLLEEAEEVETTLQRIMAKDLSDFRLTQVFLIVISLLLFSIIGISFWYFDRQRVRNLLLLQKANRGLRTSEEKNRNLFSSIRDAILVTDTNRRIVEYNPAFIDLFGYSETEILGRPTHLLYANQQQFEEMGRKLKENVANPQSFYTILYRRKSGETFPGETAVYYLKDADGEVTGFIGLIRNIADRLAAEEEKKKLAAQLLQARKIEAIGTLTGGIAHDYNNLMSVIIGNLSLARDEVEQGSPLASFLNEANTASQKVRDLTHELMSLSRGGFPVREVGSLGDLLTTALDIIPQDSGIALAQSVSQDLKPVPYDRYMMGSVFRNVLRNAIEAMPDGGILKIKAENLLLDHETQDSGLSLKPGDYVHISIQDQGKGIPKEHLDRIFDPYFSTKDMGVRKGMGLGLATAYAIVQKHEGHIAIDSSPDDGTTVHIYLPADSRAVEMDLETASPEDESPHPMRRVLVMDDEEMLRKLARQMLERTGYIVETVKDGVEAVETYKKQKDSGTPFDAVILDLTIKGGMGGEPTIRELLKIDPRVKAIVSSGYHNDPVMSNFGKYGFMAALSKPYENKALKEALERLSE